MAAKWFCLLCSARWEMKEIPVQEGEARGTDLITFGEMFIGQTYDEAAKDTEYVRWVLTTAESGEHQTFPGLMRLGRYVAAQEGARVLEEIYMDDV